MKNVTFVLRFLLLMSLFDLDSRDVSMAQSLVAPTPAATQSSIQAEPEHEIAIPAGTKVLMELVSPLHSASAPAESGLYLETLFDVIAQNRVAIPAHTRVQGLVTRAARPGRIKGRGQLQFQFTTLILPNNYIVPIAGRLQSLPGSSHYEKKQDGRIQPVDQIDKDVWAIVGASATGAAIGAIPLGGLGALKGSLIGSGFGLGTALFTRGDDIHLPAGTRIEMTLESTVTVSASQVAAAVIRSVIPVSPAARIDNGRPERENVRKPLRPGLSSILFPQR
jgi:hypothetical protein